jgi:hypothetical protein
MISATDAVSSVLDSAFGYGDLQPAEAPRAPVSRHTAAAIPRHSASARLDVVDPARALLTRRDRETAAVGSTSYGPALRGMGAIVHSDGRYEMMAPLGITAAPTGEGAIPRSAPEELGVASGFVSTGGLAGTQKTAAAMRGVGAASSAGREGLAVYHADPVGFIQRAVDLGAPVTRVALPPDSKLTASEALHQLDGGEGGRQLRAALARLQLEERAASKSTTALAEGRERPAEADLRLRQDLLTTEDNARPTLHPATWGSGKVDATTYAHPWPLMGNGTLAPSHPAVRTFAAAGVAARDRNRLR